MNKVKKLRLQNRLTQEELSEKANISQISISNLENGKHKPNSNTRGASCEYFKLTENELFGFDSGFSFIYAKNNLQKIRNWKGLTRKKLSSELNISESVIKKVEKCQCGLTEEYMKRISDFFKVSVNQIFEKKD